MIHDLGHHGLGFLPRSIRHGTGDVLLVGKINVGFHHGASMNQPLAPALIEFSLRPGGILNGKAALRLRLRRDQIGQRLGLGEI